MNHLLASVLPVVPPAADARLRRPWTSYLLFGNSGAVPVIDLPAGRYLWNRGFLVLLLDSRGRPTHICKVRPEGEEGARNEGRVLPGISSDPQLLDVVPPALWKVIPGIQATMMAYMPGVAYTTRIRSRTTTQWAADMRTVLALADRVSESALVRLATPGGRAGGLDIAEESAEAMERLEGLGIERTPRETIRAALSAGGAVSAASQHGDLWPANLLVDGESWCLLDFELFGTERAPLYDAFHLIRTCMTARASEGQEHRWIDQVLGAHPDAVAARAILSEAAARAGLDRSQAVACLLHYLVAFALRCAKLHLPDVFMAPLLREIRRAAELASANVRAFEAIFDAQAPR